MTKQHHLMKDSNFIICDIFHYNIRGVSPPPPPLGPHAPQAAKSNANRLENGRVVGALEISAIFCETEFCDIYIDCNQWSQRQCCGYCIKGKKKTLSVTVNASIWFFDKCGADLIL